MSMANISKISPLRPRIDNSVWLKLALELKFLWRLDESYDWNVQQIQQYNRIQNGKNGRTSTEAKWPTLEFRFLTRPWTWQQSPTPQPELTICCGLSTFFFVCFAGISPK